MEDKNQKFHFGLKVCPSKLVGGEGEKGKKRKRRKKRKKKGEKNQTKVCFHFCNHGYLDS